MYSDEGQTWREPKEQDCCEELEERHIEIMRKQEKSRNLIKKAVGTTGGRSQKCGAGSDGVFGTACVFQGRMKSRKRWTRDPRRRQLHGKVGSEPWTERNLRGIIEVFKVRNDKKIPSDSPGAVHAEDAIQLCAGRDCEISAGEIFTQSTVRVQKTAWEGNNGVGLCGGVACGWYDMRDPECQ